VARAPIERDCEHGIGTEKKPYFLELEDPAKIARDFLDKRLKK